MKVGIVTIISNNYGNRLQNYALQEVLQELQVDVETLPVEIKYDLKGMVKLRLKTIASWFKQKYADVAWGWFDQNIHWSQYTTLTEGIGNKYDFFVAGSDQIWNPLFECNSDREFLVFTEGKKKIAYAASIGLDELPQNVISEYRDYIEDFRAVSVREKTAADIIENLGCCRPKVVLDPTMLLTAKQWETIVDRSKIKIKRNYIVVYFLGQRTIEYDTYITSKAKEMQAEIVDIMNPSSKLENKIGPAEFISLIYNSKAVFTDSFHGSVFSILFHKSFVVFERPYEDGYGKMSSRLDTLLDTFDFNERRINNKKQIEKFKMECDFSKADEILKIKREYSVEYLKQALQCRMDGQKNED